MSSEAASGSTAAAPPPFSAWWIFSPAKTERDIAARPSDGLVVFSVMWGMAMMLSAASRVNLLRGDGGLLIAGISWAILGACALLVMYPRRTRLLLLVTGLMLAQYVLRLPVSSNNQTIAFFMNVAVFIAIAVQAVKSRGAAIARDVPYEQLRVVARALLAIMYFYGIFHKINTGFLDPEVSCASALYMPLARPFGLGESVVGMYLAIASTFIIEAIAIVCLYWRRFFWVGLLVSLPFHYAIPISGYSWYMDFSSLVFALYMLSVPRDVASGLYSTGVWLMRRVPRMRPGITAVVALALVWGVAGAAVLVAAKLAYPDRALALLWHSAWLMVWTLFGGVSMILITRAALLEQPYKEPAGMPGVRRGQSWWVYAVPAVLFVSAASPYFGLKTESTIAMFSNLHTEGGVSNHLLFPRPPYLFDYQSKVARVLDTSEPRLKAQAAAPGFGLVEHDIAVRLRADPQMWITYEIDGQRHERVNWASFTGHRPNWLERRFLVFKPVDWTRPKICSH